MKILRFTFKNEAKWMMIMCLGLPMLGFLVLLIVFFLRRF